MDYYARLLRLKKLYAHLSPCGECVPNGENKIHAMGITCSFCGQCFSEENLEKLSQMNEDTATKLIDYAVSLGGVIKNNRLKLEPIRGDQPELIPEPVGYY